MGAQLTRSKGESGAPTQGAIDLGSAAFLDAGGSGQMQPPREKFSLLGVVCERPTKNRSYGTVCNRILIKLPKLQTWISFGDCGSPEPVASQGAARPRLHRPTACTLAAALPNHCPWRLRLQNPAVATLLDVNSKDETFQPSSEPTAGLWGRIPKALPPRCSAFAGRSAPMCWVRGGSLSEC